MKLLTGLAFAAAFLAPAWALAADDAPPAANAASSSIYKGYDVGLIGHFMTADPVIKVFYDRSEAIDGPTIGLYLTRRRPNGFRITANLAYTTFSPKDGAWLAAGKDPPSSEYTEFRQGSSRGFSIVSADFLLGHVFNEEGAFQFYMGGGVGLAIPMGKVTSFDTTGPNFDQNAGSNPKNKLKNVPGVVPTVVVKLGPSVNIGTRAVLGAETGLQDGLFVGLSLGMRL